MQQDMESKATTDKEQTYSKKDILQLTRFDAYMNKAHLMVYFGCSAKFSWSYGTKLNYTSQI